MRVQTGRRTCNLLPEGADGIPAGLAVETEAAVAKLGERFASDMLTGQDARKDEIEYRDPVVHTAGGNAEDGNCGFRIADCGLNTVRG